MGTRSRKQILAALGQQAIDYLDQTHECLFCRTNDGDDGGDHHEADCPVYEAEQEIGAQAGAGGKETL